MPDMPDSQPPAATPSNPVRSHDTPHVQPASQLENSAELLRSILNTVDDGIITIDEQGIVQSLNPAAEKLFGYAAAELVGRSVNVLMPEPYHSEHDQHLRTYLETGQAHIIGKGREVTGVRKDGSVFTFYLAVSEFSQQRTRFFTGIVRDLTELKRAEEELARLFVREQAARREAERITQRIARLQALTAALSRALTIEGATDVTVAQGTATVGAAAGMMALLDESGERLWILKSMGYSSGSPEPGYSFSIDSHSPYAEAARRGEPIWITSAGQLTADYPDALFLAYYPTSVAIPLIDKGRAIGVLCASFGERRTPQEPDRAFLLAVGQQCAQAIERSRLYESERRAREIAEEAIRTRDEFISVASHELRTPITSALGYAQLLDARVAAGEGTAEENQRMIGVIEGQIERLNKMVALLLDISRIERGQLVLERGRVNLTGLLQRLVEQVEPSLRHHRLEFANRAGEVIIEGDELRLEQVLQNLVQNAIKYSPMGGLISIAMAREDGRVRISVSDCGIGIPEDEMHKLFSRFYRTRNAVANHISGLGVGLYVVREIVNQHGGEIQVESEEGKGSTFTIWLPLLA